MVGVLPNETSASTLAMKAILRSSEGVGTNALPLDGHTPIDRKNRISNIRDVTQAVGMRQEKNEMSLSEAAVMR